jgi:hypothetical protein
MPDCNGLYNTFARRIFDAVMRGIIVRVNYPPLKRWVVDEAVI